MNNRFIVITEIFFNQTKISRERKQKESLSISDRNQVIRTMFYNLYGKMKSMDIYSRICILLAEQYGIEISERTVMRAIADRFRKNANILTGIS